MPLPIAHPATDLVVLGHRDGERHLLLVRRGSMPYEGMWALPGGFIEAGEDAREAAVRELREEAGISVDPAEVRQIGAYTAPKRDPRRRVISVAHLVELDGTPEVAGGDDAAEARWFPLGELPELLAFDHAQIVADALALIGG